MLDGSPKAHFMLAGAKYGIKFEMCKKKREKSETGRVKKVEK